MIKELDDTIFEPNMRGLHSPYLYFTGYNINQNMQNDRIKKIDTLINEIDNMLNN